MSATASATETTAKAGRPRICRFYNAKGGCRAGSTCPYLHTELKTDHAPTSQRQYQVQSVEVSRVVAKPQPQDPRAFHIGQIKRRFNPEHVETEHGSTYTFSFTPSDPDFPFDLDALSCQLEVPKAYPNTAPRLKILNTEIPRGFQINIERGFAAIHSSNAKSTLLGTMNQLDKRLEAILSGEQAETMTIKIVANRSKEPAPKVEAPQHVQQPIVEVSPMPRYTQEDKAKASAQRQADTRQLEARFGRLPAFKKSSDGTRYTLPLESPKRYTWPTSVQNLKIFTLIVPDLYPLEQASLVLESDSKEARNIEAAFTRKASGTLTQMINNLTIHLKTWAAEEEQPLTIATPEPAKVTAPTTYEIRPTIEGPAVEDKPHVHVIPRPPEWDIRDEDDSDEDSYDSGDDTEATASEEEIVIATAPLERGVLMSFPGLELYGIELLEVATLSITIKCDRCKDTMDVDKLKGTEQSLICKKCANSLAIAFRADLMHTNSSRAGYLDLDGCTVVDMLLSSFIPTCSECSVAHPAIVSVRGETAAANCRECHKKMSFRIPEVKFLQLSIANTKMRPTRKKVRENLGISAGTELPRRGRCTHYAKSYRWFRFSCCSKVYACDRCHDEAEEHPNEHANRMLCGYCSREQNYRPEDCGICHAVLIGKRGRGFWEGGKGTRDKARMSRKDPRKYKRIGGSAKKS